MKSFIIALSVILLSCNLNAQTTGSFEETVAFDEPDYSFTRTLYYFVPEDYDPAQAYKLVVGFRGGPHSNAGQFRDQLTFLAEELDAIILCPENSGHFWNEEGLTKQLFEYSVNAVEEIYNIDPEFIYLTGLSYGGRHTVIVGTDTDNGAIPNLRGIIPFAIGSEGDLQPNYESIEEFAPACICIGLDDSSNFIAVANNLHNDIQANGGTSLLNEIPGVGHTVDFPTYEEEMMECFNFIEDQYPNSISENFELTDDQVKIYPNPTSGEVRIEFPENFIPEQIQIEDLNGKIVLNLSNKNVTHDISSLANGQYNLVVILNAKRKAKQIAVSK